jgi:DNA-3-methyladenine glycosylase I
MQISAEEPALSYMKSELPRCPWPKDDLYRAYHDLEWGIPVHDDQQLFEMLILEGAQAGLSWSTILKKRENYRAAFHQFDPGRVARYDHRKIQALLANEGIVRNRLKTSTVATALRQITPVHACAVAF